MNKNTLFKIALPNLIIFILSIIYKINSSNNLMAISLFIVFPILYILQGIINANCFKHLLFSFLISSIVVLATVQYGYIYLSIYLLLGLFSVLITKFTNKTFSFFMIVTTIISIMLNFDISIKGFTKPTFINFMCSIIFYLIWFIFSFYSGLKKNYSYRKFLTIYWAIGIISLILLILSDKYAFFTNYIIVPAIWFLIPTYGIDYIFNLSTNGLIIVLPVIGLIISYLGYFIGSRKNNK